MLPERTLRVGIGMVLVRGSSAPVHATSGALQKVDHARGMGQAGPRSADRLSAKFIGAALRRGISIGLAYFLISTCSTFTGPPNFFAKFWASTRFVNIRAFDLSGVHSSSSDTK